MRMDSDVWAGRWAVLLHYNCKINANIQDVYHRPNLERAQNVGCRLFKLCIIQFYWPTPPTIHRGLEWPQFLNSLSVCSLIVCLSVLCKFSNFL